MQVTPNHLVLHMFQNGFQEDYPHQLVEDQGEADQPVVPQIFLLGLCEDRRNIHFLVVLSITIVFQELLTSFAVIRSLSIHGGSTWSSWMFSLLKRS